MSPKPLVSAIIPTRNRAHLIGTTLESLQNQTYRSIEVVVVDDGGTDDTAEIVAEFPNTNYIRQPAYGVSAARNTGFRRSAGVYVQWLDSDDLLEPDKIRRHVEFLEASSGVDIVYGDARYFTTDAPQRRDYGLSDYQPMENCGAWIKLGWEAPGPMASKLVRGNIIPICCPLSRRSAVEQIGDWTEGISENEDWEFWTRGAAMGLKFQFLEGDGTLALIRSHSDSLTRQFDSLSQLPVRLQLARHLTGRLAIDNYDFASDLIRQQPTKDRIASEFALLVAALGNPAVMMPALRGRVIARLRALFSNRSSGEHLTA